MSQPSPTFDDRALHARRRLRGSDVLVRAATAQLLRQQVRPGMFQAVEEVIRDRFNNCLATLFYTRAAVNPAQTTVATWAAELVSQSIIDFIATDMVRQSGFAQLAQRAMVVPFELGTGSVSVPARASPLSLMGQWVLEGGPKPVYAGSLTATSLVPYKLSAVSTFSEEMVMRSAIESIVRETLAHDLSCLLDAAIFDAAAASAARPAGLWNGAVAVTPSATTPSNEAMIADLRGLAAAVAGTANPDASVVFVVNPAQALRIGLLAPQYQNLIVSGFMTGGNVGAIDVSSIAMLVGLPQFMTSRDAALHFDSVPAALAPGGATVISSPVRSLFQEDLLALRAVLRVGWARRRANCTALASAVTW